MPFKSVPKVLFLAAIFPLAAAGLWAQSAPAVTLTVDATEAPLKIIRTHMLIPVKPGPVTFEYPKWIPGEHEPDGPIANVTGLKFQANGKIIPWRRDLLDVFTLHVDVPQGVDQLDVSFDYLEPDSGSVYTGGASATDKLVDINWNQNLLYPAGIPAERLMYKASLILPGGWKFGTALPVASQSGNSITFTSVPLNRLVDSPVIAGEYYRSYNLTPPGEPIHHEIDIVADSAEAAAMSPDLQKEMTNVVAESGKMFGARHYRDYHFLLTLSDHVAHFGLEHHECDDSRLGERTLLGPRASVALGGILPHEFVHSWNGKFRRPKDLSAPYFEAPMETDMLWVYEGLTNYLGHILATRAGLWTTKDYDRYLATDAASLGPGRPGRTWRPLLDTTAAVPGMFGFDDGWMNWKRGMDYYGEGDLIWLWVANIIHQQSHGKKSFEDFCHLFYGGPNEGPQLKPYTFDDLVNALNSVTPYNWAAFFHERLDSTSPDSPEQGIEMSGWKLVFNSKAVGADRDEDSVSALYSIGLTLGDDGNVTDSVWNGPAFKAGVEPGMEVVGVNGRVYAPELLKDAIKDSNKNSHPITLLMVNDEYYKTCTIDYHGGQRYPHLVREQGAPDYLDELLKPLN
ncbi:MAG TPA: M61 family peptidase [Terriglobia bacterium]|nr:M61 family peptidase [Terriglobia bacterium]